MFLVTQGIVLKSLAVAAVLFYVSFFEVGLGPIPWLIVAEVCVNVLSHSSLFDNCFFLFVDV